MFPLRKLVNLGIKGKNQRLKTDTVYGPLHSGYLHIKYLFSISVSSQNRTNTLLYYKNFLNHKDFCEVDLNELFKDELNKDFLENLGIFKNKKQTSENEPKSSINPRP